MTPTASRALEAQKNANLPGVPDATRSALKIPYDGFQVLWEICLLDTHGSLGAPWRRKGVCAQYSTWSKNVGAPGGSG